MLVCYGKKLYEQMKHDLFILCLYLVITHFLCIYIYQDMYEKIISPINKLVLSWCITYIKFF